MKIYFEIARLAASKSIQFCCYKYDRDSRVIECIKDYADKVILKKRMAKQKDTYVAPPIIEKEMYDLLDAGNRAEDIADKYFISGQLVIKYAEKYIERTGAPVDPVEAEKIASLFDTAVATNVAKFKRNEAASINGLSEGDTIFIQDFYNSSLDNIEKTPAKVLAIINDKVPMVKVVARGFFGPVETIVLASQIIK